MTLDAILRQNLAHPQRPQRGDIALAGQIRRQVFDPLLNISHLSDQSDGEDQIGEHCQKHEDAKTQISGVWSFRRHVTILLRLLAIPRLVEQKGA